MGDEVIATVNTDNSFALDVQGVADLRLKAKTDPDAALKGAAKQFEAVFMQMLMKSMRDTVGEDSMFDSEDTKQYTAMLDQQLSQSLSGKGLGLAEAMVRQLRGSAMATGNQGPTGSGGSSMGAAMAAAAASSAGSPPTSLRPAQGAPMAIDPARVGVTGSGSATAPAPASGLGSSPSNFVNTLWPHAAEASRATGIPPSFMIGHAALETGWGKSEIRGADGQPSYNLFSIKAGKGWTGPTVETVTTEYVNGVPQKSVEKFRAYASYAEAFKDYASLLKSSPRYSVAVNSNNDPAVFAAGLQQGGYATDPMYADKLNRILQGNTLRQSLLG